MANGKNSGASRRRTNSGTFRRKRGDTRIGKIEKEYNINLGRRSDMKLSTYLRQSGYKSLGNVIDQAESKN